MVCLGPVKINQPVKKLSFWRKKHENGDFWRRFSSQLLNQFYQFSCLQTSRYLIWGNHLVSESYCCSLWSYSSFTDSECALTQFGYRKAGFTLLLLIFYQKQCQLSFLSHSEAYLTSQCQLRAIFKVSSCWLLVSVKSLFLIVFAHFFLCFFRHNGKERGFEIRFHAYLLLTGDHFRDMRVTRRGIVHGTGMGSFSLNRLWKFSLKASSRNWLEIRKNREKMSKNGQK